MDSVMAKDSVGRTGGDNEGATRAVAADFSSPLGGMHAASDLCSLHDCGRRARNLAGGGGQVSMTMFVAAHARGESESA